MDLRKTGKIIRLAEIMFCIEDVLVQYWKIGYFKKQQSQSCPEAADRKLRLRANLTSDRSQFFEFFFGCAFCTWFATMRGPSDSSPKQATQTAFYAVQININH